MTMTLRKTEPFLLDTSIRFRMTQHPADILYVMKSFLCAQANFVAFVFEFFILSMYKGLRAGGEFMYTKRRKKKSLQLKSQTVL